MIHDNGLTTFREFVGSAFSAGMKAFPHFTLHGKEHLEELDRLALMITQVIPQQLDSKAINLLRLALIMHDYAMVSVPAPEREAELRAQMKPEISFADVVRKTHQDELVHLFTKPEMTEHLKGSFAAAAPADFEDACTIARFHRFHSLKEAPEHLRELCALMRLIDELDIGPRRAPQPAYEARRAGMDQVSRLHWLKHICTREIERQLCPTLTVEEPRKDRRILRVWIAVKATADTWEGLQDLVYRKIKKCLEEEGVNLVLREQFHLEVRLEKGPDYLCGEQPFLSQQTRDDLAELAAASLLGDENSAKRDPEASPRKELEI